MIEVPHQCESVRAHTSPRSLVYSKLVVFRTLWRQLLRYLAGIKGGKVGRTCVVVVIVILGGNGEKFIVNLYSFVVRRFSFCLVIVSSLFCAVVREKSFNNSNFGC